MKYSIVALITSSLVLTGCGGSGGSSTPENPYSNCEADTMVSHTVSGETDVFDLTVNNCNLITQITAVNNNVTSVTSGVYGLATYSDFLDSSLPPFVNGESTLLVWDKVSNVISSSSCTLQATDYTCYLDNVITPDSLEWDNALFELYVPRAAATFVMSELVELY